MLENVGRHSECIERRPACQQGRYQVRLSRTTIQQGRETRRCGADSRAISRGGFAPRSARLRVGRFLCKQQLAQHVKIPSQHVQANVTLKPWFRPIAATFQPVARLQGVDCRLNSRMRLPRLTKLDTRRPLLFDRLLRARHGQAWVGNKRRQGPGERQSPLLDATEQRADRLRTVDRVFPRDAVLLGPLIDGGIEDGVETTLGRPIDEKRRRGSF